MTRDQIIYQRPSAPAQIGWTVASTPFGENLSPPRRHAPAELVEHGNEVGPQPAVDDQPVIAELQRKHQ